MIAARDPPEIYQYQFAYSPDLTVVFKLLDGIVSQSPMKSNGLLQRRRVLLFQV